MKPTCPHNFVECKGPHGHGGFDGIKAPVGKWMVSCPDPAQYGGCGCGRVFAVEADCAAALKAAKLEEPSLRYVWRGGLKYFWNPQFGNPGMSEIRI